ncbi:3-beta hydroxysteroid dehydrogenase/isomerase family protein [Burkholderia thailandensis MSMB121]|uniref:complex I NDUFA9 subunit family protein n=1 Tax=Burkholderia TaxID=32008 RepID=UPI0003280F08|nr:MULTISPECIES: complex I NDUFA9 subunit family protein [Burkholderia]AGK47613.1 3-beta hydroxysteroid dehydrogenase/isomerase family protein [Burkholderia thailandensis MSMB121]ATF35144.1 complex I NDUFA9 subunit family protein [Burkholderia thailandensis]KST75714.1 NAD-dependent dehydratase [Burkholderia humptydooensis]
MQGQTIAVLGGTGFIGSRLVNALVEAGARVRIGSRRREHARHLAMLPVDIVELSAFDVRELARFVAGANAAVNLVGVLHGGHGKPYGERFERLHVALPAALAAACIEARVPRMLHVSALGADPRAPSMYLRSKGDGEAALRAQAAAGVLDVTVFRPSIVFGPGDAFVNTFARLQRIFPVLPLAMPDALMQPIYVGDVAQAIANACARDATRGRTYELGGPRTYRLEEIVRYAGRLAGRPARIVRLPDALARLQACVFEMLPGEPLITRDNLASLSVPSVMTGPIAPELGITPASLESIAPTYIGDAAPRSRFPGRRTRR